MTERDQRALIGLIPSPGRRIVVGITMTHQAHAISLNYSLYRTQAAIHYANRSLANAGQIPNQALQFIQR